MCNHNKCQRGSKCVACSLDDYECDCPPWASGRFCQDLNPQYDQSLLPWEQGLGSRIRYVDIAFDTAWCTTIDRNIFMHVNGVWTYVDGVAHQVTIGESGVWCINWGSAHIFYRAGVTESNPSGTEWHHDLSGLLWQITSGPAGIIWGLNGANELYFRHNSRWNYIRNGLKWVSCGKFGCWAVTTNGFAYFRVGVTASIPAGVSWVDTGGSFKQLDTGVRGEVYAVDNLGQVYTREGVSENSPEGKKWSKFGNKLFKHISVGDNIVFAVSPEGHDFTLK